MKFFVDNNLPPALSRALHELCKPDGHEVVHLRDRFQADTTDTEWIGVLAKEGGWVVVTHDKLLKGIEREALRRAGILVFLLDKSWASQPFWLKASQVVRWWPRIMDQTEGISGGGMFAVPWQFSGKGQFKQIRI